MTATSPIERVVLTHLQIPLKEPFRISGGEVADQGRHPGHGRDRRRAIGHGESSPMAASFGYSADTPEGCWDDLRTSIAPGLIGQTVDSPAAIAALAAAWKGSRFAAAGAENALWDLLGQAHHATVAQLLGAIDEQISLGVQSGLAVGLYPSIVELLKTIETHLAEGYRRVKIKIQPGNDVELVRAVRQHFGEISLMVDANGAYTLADIDMFRELDEFDLLMFEQPMKADDLDGLARLQQAVTTPVCLDESAETLEQTAEAIRPGRLPDRQPQDPARGRAGPGPGHPRPLPPARHRLLGRLHARARASARPLAFTWPRWPTASTPPTSSRPHAGSSTTTSFPRSSSPAPGLFSVPRRPGVGFQVDPVKVRRYQVRQEEFTLPDRRLSDARNRPHEPIPRQRRDFLASLGRHGLAGVASRRPDSTARGSADHRHPCPSLGPQDIPPGLAGRGPCPQPQLPRGTTTGRPARG